MIIAEQLEKYQRNGLVLLLEMLSKRNKCIHSNCGYKEKEGWIRPFPKQVVSIHHLLPKFFWHYKSTHGIDPETLVEYLNKDF